MIVVERGINVSSGIVIFLSRKEFSGEDDFKTYSSSVLSSCTYYECRRISNFPLEERGVFFKTVNHIKY